MEDLDQSNYTLHISEIIIDPDLYRSKKKAKSKQKAKTKAKQKISDTTNDQSSGEAHDFEALVFPAGTFFIILFHALEDGQDIAYLEKKYLGPPAKSVEELIVIKSEDYELVKTWSEKYPVPAIVRGVHEIVDAQVRRPINKKDHRALVEVIFMNVSAIRDDIHEHFKGSDILEDYDILFIKLSYFIMELATLDLSSETGEGVPVETDDFEPSETAHTRGVDLWETAQTGDAEKEYGLEVD